jgi:hypothetical protein
MDQGNGAHYIWAVPARTPSDRCFAGRFAQKHAARWAKSVIILRSTADRRGAGVANSTLRCENGPIEATNPLFRAVAPGVRVG